MMHSPSIRSTSAVRDAWRSHHRVLVVLGSSGLVGLALLAAGRSASRGDAVSTQGTAPSIATGQRLDPGRPSPASGSEPVRAQVTDSARSPTPSPPIDSATFVGDRAETERFVSYDRDIQLTPEQEQVRVAALTPLPAPCCKNFSAATCCCRCNMAKATWGLAKQLIVRERANAERVRLTVAAWHRAINPDGFTGDACFTGGCNRAFAKNGCGGMVEGELVF